jgi:hypothetical protein
MTLERLEEQGEGLRWREVEPPFDCQFDTKVGLLECSRSRKERLEKALAVNEALIRRYLFLQVLPHYTVVPQESDSEFFIAAMSQMMSNARRLLVAQALMDIERGNTEVGLTFFRKDFAFWHRNLEGKSNVLHSAVALDHVTRSVYQLSFLLSSPSTNIEERKPEWRELLTPLSHEQANMRPAIEGEIRYFRRAYDGLSISLRETASRQETAPRRVLMQHFQTFLFRPYATFNYNAPSFKAWLVLAELPRKDYIEQRDEVLASLTGLPRLKSLWLFYNPVGKHLFRKSGDFKYVGGYIERMHDLEAYLRMVRLQLELRLAKIPSEDVPAFIEQLDEAYCAPCSDFSWDAETRMLSFQPYNEEWFTRHASASVYVPE